MLMAPIPPDEQERLIDLQATHLLDTPPEKRFDQLVELARDIFQVPITYIALVGSDRQWFKSKCGLTTDSTGRDISFCGHAIARREPLIIPDALNDERFYDNPLVVGEPGVRFYAGHPLAGPNGHNIATLCLVDRQPRQLSPSQVQLFRRLAAIAEHEINLVDLVRMQRELITARDALTLAQRKMAQEIEKAADYVKSLLPEPLSEAPVTSGYRFIASSQLGGDTFGHFWLDDEKTQLAVYLLDVAGHGIGSSLLAVTVASTLQRQTLANADFHDPASVLTALNTAFPMEKSQDKFFTIWYGVYDNRTRMLTYAGAGHHPAILYEPSANQPRLLGEPALMIGMMPDAEYENHQQSITPGSLLHVFSDGAFEVTDGDGKMLGFEGLMAMLDQLHQRPADTSDKSETRLHDERLDLITHQIRRYQGSFHFQDDYSLMELRFA